MLQVLLESHAVRPRRAGSTVASAVMHGALLAAIIWLAHPRAGRAIMPTAPVEQPVYVPVHPETRADHRIDQRSARGGVQAGRSLPMPIFGPTELPPIDLTVADPVVTDLGAPGTNDDLAVHRGFPTDGSRLQYAGDVVDEHLVDRAPRVIGRPPEPRYPAPLRDAGIQGRVVAEFVVDTLGRAELDGLKLNAPQPLFAEAVRAVLPRYRFTPGEAGRGKVRTRVQLPFDFTLAR